MSERHVAPQHDPLMAPPTPDEPELRQIPVVVLTTSDEERDIAASYALGANAYMVKPSAFDDMVSVAEVVKAHWLEAVRLPP